MKKIIVLSVIGTVDRHATLDAIKEFAQDALSTWGGQLHPDDPLFASIDVTRVDVARVVNKVQSRD